MTRRAARRPREIRNYFEWSRAPSSVTMRWKWVMPSSANQTLARARNAIAVVPQLCIAPLRLVSGGTDWRRSGPLHKPTRWLG
jgi:hypothetical protein